jgi:hypothetical protein
VVDVLVRGAERAAGGDVVILAVGVGAARSRLSGLAMVAVIDGLHNSSYFPVQNTGD